MTVRGTLLESPQQHGYDQHEEISSRSVTQVHVTAVQLQNAAWRYAFGRVVVSTPGILPTYLFAGQTVEIGGVLRFPKPAVAKGTFDYQTT